MVLSRLHRAYERGFKTSPVLTLAVTNAVLKCLGDFMAQLLPHLHSPEGLHGFFFDGHRSLRFLFFGFVSGPIIGKWHEALEHYMPLAPQHRPPTLSPSAPAMAYLDTPGADGKGKGGSLAPYDGTPKLPKNPRLSDSQYHTDPKQLAAFQAFQLTKRVLADQLIWAPLYLASFIVTMALLEGLGWSTAVERFERLYWPILSTNWKVWPLIQLINFRLVPLQYRVAWQGACGVCWTVFLSFATHSASHGTPPPSVSSAREDLVSAAAVTSASKEVSQALRRVGDTIQGGHGGERFQKTLRAVAGEAPAGNGEAPPVDKLPT